MTTQRRAINSPLKLRGSYGSGGDCNCEEGDERCMQAVEVEQPEKWIQIKKSDKPSNSSIEKS
eukprot:11861367-Karenia_brevis.AAC.1